MKTLIYLFTLLFNAVGFLFSTAFLFFINLDNILFLPIVLISCLIFCTSFSVTLYDFMQGKYFVHIKKTAKINRTDNVILDYKDYFKTRKSDFIIG